MKKHALKFLIAAVVGIFFVFTFGSCILGVGYVTLTNTTGADTVTYFWVSSSSSSSWGSDRLGSSTLGPGDFITVDVTSGNNDARIYVYDFSLDLSYYDYEYGFYVPPGGTYNLVWDGTNLW
ncbi:MAG: hypothetical protein JXD23_06250 [Spirochaetales bacterium]|nr:hypothetical protein [Spirochaetales bacterium]